MIRKNKWTLIIASAVIVLPMAVGAVLWDKLPDIMTTHWGVDGAADGTAGKVFAVFGVPLILLALFWLCVVFTARDPGNRNQNGKVLSAVLWIVPILSLLVSAGIYFVSFGKEFEMPAVIFALLGVMFLLLGNYMPKCRQNSTIGIKIKWTLANEENWNATHRFGGKVWVLCGLAMLACIFLPLKTAVYVMLGVIAVAVLLPFIYSWLFHKKQVKAGTAPEKVRMPDTRFDRAGKIITAIFLPLILVGVAIVMFTGTVETSFGTDSFTVDATYYGEAKVAYDAIDSAVYRTDFDGGVRVSGFGSARLSLGNFQCDELGRYTLYAYTGFDECVVLTSGDKHLVVALEDGEATRAFYDELMTHIG